MGPRSVPRHGRGREGAADTGLIWWLCPVCAGCTCWCDSLHTHTPGLARAGRERKTGEGKTGINAVQERHAGAQQTNAEQAHWLFLSVPGSLAMPGC